MGSLALEQMLSSVPRMGQEDRAYQTLDVYTNGLSQMYTGPMGPPGGPGPINQQINPILDGNVRLDLDKSTNNTYIMKQYVDEIEDSVARYIHHDRGPGRTDTP